MSNAAVADLPPSSTAKPPSSPPAPTSTVRTPSTKSIAQPAHTASSSSTPTAWTSRSMILLELHSSITLLAAFLISTSCPGAKPIMSEYKSAAEAETDIHRTNPPSHNPVFIFCLGLKPIPSILATGFTRFYLPTAKTAPHPQAFYCDRASRIYRVVFEAVNESRKTSILRFTRSGMSSWVQ